MLCDHTIIRNYIISFSECLEYSKYVFKKIYDPEEDDFIEYDTCKAAEPLIVGGRNANPKEFPHQVSI